jgi:hypothetical protein
MLSKSRFVRGTNCIKSLWLYKHKREEQVISEATQAIFSRGTNVGELATECFPGGVMAVTGNFPTTESAKYTKELIEQGVETIYEATFIYDNTLVAIDILHKKNGKWYLYEVKSTNSAKQEHVKDVAVQYYVVTGTGIPLEDVFVMHFDRSYIRRGELEPEKLFKSTSVLTGALAWQHEVKSKIPDLLTMLEGSEPEIEMGSQCKNPYICDYTEYCKSLNPNIGKKTELSSIPEVLPDKVREFVNSVVYPICHLDFETIMPGVPLFNESRPYQQIPFQYSIHFQNERDCDISHCEYLAPSDLSIDPRKGLIEKMIKETKDAKTIFVYSIAFERTRIYEMIRDFPEYESDLQSIVARLKDLIIPFRKKYYRTETMLGRYSIKIVLPAICPELSYDDLKYSDGMAASNAFLDLYYCNDAETIAKTREDLLKYCHLDTLAMVKIFEVLCEV